MIYEFYSHEQPNTKSTKQMLCPQDELGESTLKEKRAEAAGGVFSTRRLHARRTQGITAPCVSPGSAAVQCTARACTCLRMTNLYL